MMQIFAINCGNACVTTSKKAVPDYRSDEDLEERASEKDSSDVCGCFSLPEREFAGFLKDEKSLKPVLDYGEKPIIPILYCNDCKREKRFAGMRITTSKGACSYVSDKVGSFYIPLSGLVRSEWMLSTIKKFDKLKGLPEGSTETEEAMLRVIKNALEWYPVVEDGQNKCDVASKWIRNMDEWLSPRRDYLDYTYLKAFREIISIEDSEKIKCRAAVPEEIELAFSRLDVSRTDGSLNDVLRSYQTYRRCRGEFLVPKDRLEVLKRSVKTIFSYYGKENPFPQRPSDYNPRVLSYPFAKSLLLIEDIKPAGDGKDDSCAGGSEELADAGEASLHDNSSLLTAQSQRFAGLKRGRDFPSSYEPSSGSGTGSVELK